MTHYELREKVLRAAEEAFGADYTPTQLGKVERIWDAAIKAATKAARDEARIWRERGEDETAVGAASAAVAILVLRATP
jgi:hypothetical protein